MSECVVRMEIPENCLKCPLRNQCEIFCDWFGRFGTSAMRKPYPKPFDKGCHILTVLPEGHGPLVDKDEMLKKIENYHRYMTIGRESDPRCIIEDSPTIVPADTAERR